MISNDSPIFSLEDVLKATAGILISGTPENTFYGISTDSRQVNKGNLFIALKGEKFDGHDFVQTALEQGAAGSFGAVMRQKLIKREWIKMLP